MKSITNGCWPKPIPLLTWSANSWSISTTPTVACPTRHSHPFLIYPSDPTPIYADARACIFCDGSVHDRPEVQAQDRRQRAALEDLGYRVIVIRYDRDFEEQTGAYEDVFGKLQGVNYNPHSAP